jgi:hypothetical protein
MSPIAGTWRVASGHAYDAELRSRVRFREGRLVYGDDGTFSARCVISPDAGGGEAHESMPEERIVYGYAGRYEVDAARGVLSHHILSSDFPEEIGTTVYRMYELSDHTLVIRFQDSPLAEGSGSVGSHGCVTLEREGI